MAAPKPKPPSSPSSVEDGRFPPGTLLGERYRIISLVGRGGMGEVYRATDIKLNHPVALKFLPPNVAARPGLLERFHGEVRIARQVSHPNVCRVYDIGEAEGSAYISMEYVDGEDLGSLLRRIGRLPSDKGIENALGWYRWQQMGVLAPSATATAMLDPAQFVRLLLAGIFVPAVILLGLLLLFLLLRLIVRNTWVAAVGVVALWAAVNPDPVVSGVSFGCTMVLMLRFGILPGVLMYFFYLWVGASPMTPDLSAWYASRGLFVMGLTLALAVWSFRHALGGRKVLKGDLFEP